MGRRCGVMIALALAAQLAAPAGDASAEDSDDAREARAHFEKGRREFDIGLYDKAIEEFQIAYTIKNDPVLLRNIAQCHRLAGHLQLAVVYYNNYLRVQPQAPAHDEIEGLIAELERKLAQVAPPVVEPPRPPVRVAPRPRRGMQFAGVVLLTGGVLGAAAGGIGFGLSAVAQGDELRREAQLHLSFDPAVESSGNAFQALAITSYVVGAVVAALGAVLIGLARRPGAAE
jgi:tetratricopeptide (TPR) repeat protein